MKRGTPTASHDPITIDCDVDLASFDQIGLQDLSEDEVLAHFIRADANRLWEQGVDVTLSRYLAVIATVSDPELAMDAAIEVALNSMTTKGVSLARAKDVLCTQYPYLKSVIHDTATLSAAVLLSSGMPQCVHYPDLRTLPCDFGPLMHNGGQRYQLQELLGHGAGGHVYRAIDRQVHGPRGGSTVAIKLLFRSSVSVEGHQHSFAEATNARRINHPNVIRVFDCGVDDLGQGYVVYENAERGDLETASGEFAGHSVTKAVALISAVSRGLHAAHLAGVSHCDLKPQNILLTAAGEPKIGDFGITALSNPQGVDRDQGVENVGPIGNIAFMSPEQYRREGTGFSLASDIYAVGGVLFWLLTGELPNGSTLDEIRHTHDVRSGRQEAPSVRCLRREVDRDLDAICRRAMAIRPQHRYPSAQALADDLDRWLRQKSLDWTNPSLLRRVTLWKRRNNRLARAVMTIALLTTANGIATLCLGLMRQTRIEAGAATGFAVNNVLETQKDKETAATAIMVVQHALLGDLDELGDGS